jgi:hypothetical protein
VTVENGQNRPDRTSSSPAKAALLTLRFLAELALIVVLVIAGASTGSQLATRIVLAICLPVAVMAFWGVFLAPRSRRRLGDPARLVAEIVLFGAAAAYLAVVASVIGAAVFGVITIGAAGLSRVYAPEG